MPRIDSEKFYTSAIDVHGTSAKGVNWASKENQTLRFEAILKLLPSRLANFTLVDAGCGFGDFHTYMSKKKNSPKKYIGIDSLEDMYSIASDKTGEEIIIADICKDSLPNAPLLCLQWCSECSYKVRNAPIYTKLLQLLLTRLYI